MKASPDPVGVEAEPLDWINCGGLPDVNLVKEDREITCIMQEANDFRREPEHGMAPPKDLGIIMPSLIAAQS